MYYSNEDLGNFYVRYKAEGLLQKLSIQKYCIRNKVFWNLFNKWYRDTRHRIKEVTVTGRPEEQPRGGSPRGGERIPIKGSRSGCSSVRTGSCTDNDGYRNNQGTVFQKNLSYQRLLTLVENLEVLCQISAGSNGFTMFAISTICNANMAGFCR